jgi:Tol biopolymer transport system component
MNITTRRPRATRLMRAAIAALTLALVGGCADDHFPPVAPDEAPVAPRAANGVGEHGGGPPHAIAVGSRRDGGPPGIRVMHADGSDPVQLTNSPGAVAINGQPDWSPNGQRLAFMSTRTGDAEIFVMSADGDDLQNLTSHAATDQAPTWSPNGKQVAFHSDRAGNFDLYVLDLPTGDLSRLTTHAGVDQFPAWSPDGKSMAFQRDGDIWVMDLRTGETSRLTSTPQLEDMPTWSPDGKQIAFMSQRAGYSSVFVMEANGDFPVNLTPRPIGVTTSWLSVWPDWSTDGRRIYFQGARPETAGDVEIFVVDAGGGTATRVTVAPGIDSAPVAR